jgi:signal transduction histidine kinase
MPDVAPLLETSREQMPPEMYDRLAHALRRYKSILAVPMLIGGEVYGGLTMYYPEPREFSPEDISLAEDLADHLSLALENARLRESAEESAASAERSRLARDLHDAVTQTLFSASLIAEVLPQLWERNQEEGRKRLAQLRDLTRGALAEMRTLLLELRPTALAETPLCDLLLQLAEAARGRSGIRIGVEIEGECDLPADAKIALYRIAQEALNNVAKHAGAAHAWMKLTQRVGSAELIVADDGAGFDASEKSADSLGLDIMRERAESVGADLTVTSTPGEGTRVEVFWGSGEKGSA